jgi:hypothetical protein
VLGRLNAAPPDVLVAVAETDVPRLARRTQLDDVPFDRAGRYRVYRVGDLRAHLLPGAGGERE